MGFWGVWRKGKGGRDIEPKFVAAGLRAVRLPLVELGSACVAIICVWRSRVEEGAPPAEPGGLYIESEGSVGGVGRVCCGNDAGFCGVAVVEPGQYELACPDWVSSMGDFNLAADAEFTMFSALYLDRSRLGN